MESFYLTLPSNDDSIKYFPENTPNSWKNRLSSLIALDKDGEVGMSSISLPHESRLKKYLNNLPFATRLLTTKRRVYVVVTQQLDVTTTYVHYSDIKDKPLDTPHNLLKALFEVEREKYLLNLGESGVWANEMPTGKFPDLQFDVSFNDALETCTVSAEKTIPDTLSNNDVRDHVYFELRKDLCILLGWIQPKARFNVSTFKNAANLASRKRVNVWFESRSDSSILKRYWSMEENGEMFKFYLHELMWTFINTKRSAYKRGTSASRIFYVYSSIGDPVTIGNTNNSWKNRLNRRLDLEGAWEVEGLNKDITPEKIIHLFTRYNMSNFYFTLPSNNGSIKYFPGNTSNSWKNRLYQHLDLEGDWEVGMSSISLPHESILIPYLKRLSNGSAMLKTWRVVYRKRGSSGALTEVSARVNYGDVKHRRMETAYTLLQALFEAEYVKFLDQLQNYDSLYEGDQPLQFDVMYDEGNESITVSAENVNFQLRKDSCLLFGWIKDITYKGWEKREKIYRNKKSERF
ncbi:hypothetical protein AWC38_SpisGene14840 [Stylophora pistillata]|uniref:Uncharacterized protein n=1 Tax=Stylophora pistillata TaxID=50429 RepID=A0A2B4RWV4_STYPI|nr:hypothetical protein AWC38_SpisGene14840 [Stylophora pistillata]